MFVTMSPITWAQLGSIESTLRLNYKAETKLLGSFHYAQLTGLVYRICLALESDSVGVKRPKLTV